MRFGKGLILILTLLLACLILLGWQQQEQGVSLSLELPSGDSMEEIHCWQSDSGERYFFLPAYGELEKARVRVRGRGSLLLDGTLLTDGMSCGGFALDQPYSLTDGAGESLGRVRFVQSAQMPSIYIDVASGSMDYIHEDIDHSESGSIRVYRADGSLDYSGRIDSMNGRGQSTWGAPKKPYSLTLAGGADLLGMGKAEKWILLANAYDPSHLRNKLVLDASQKGGPPYTPECRWADLYLNGEYAGLYLLTERNEVAPGRVDISREGSFLVSKDWETRLIDRKRTYITTDSNAALRVVFSALSLEELRQTWQSAENAILSPEGIDPVTGKSWQELIDLDSWARRYLIEEVFGNVDAGVRSQAFFRDGGEGKICAGPVWDYDLALGNTFAWPKPSPSMIYAHVKNIWGSGWYAALYQKEAFYRRVTELYETDFRPQLETMLATGIDAYAEEIAGAAAMNALRWGTEDAATETEGIKQYLTQRMAFLDDLWIREQPYCEVYVQVEDGVVWCYSVRPGECLPELPEYTSNAAVCYDGWYDSETNEPFDLSQPIDQDTKIYLKYGPAQKSDVSDPETAETDSQEQTSILRYGPFAILLVILACVILADIRRPGKEKRHD